MTGTQPIFDLEKFNAEVQRQTGLRQGDANAYLAELQAGYKKYKVSQLVANMVPPGADIGQMRTLVERLGVERGADVSFLLDGLKLAEQQRAEQRNIQEAQAPIAAMIGAVTGPVQALTFGQVGKIDDPEIAQNKTYKLAQAISSGLTLGLMGAGTYKVVNQFLLRPSIAAILEGIPSRTVSQLLGRTISGAVAGAVADAARPEGVPEDPASIDIPARLAQHLEGTLGPRTALAVGGAVFGGALDLTFGGLIRGIQLAKEVRVAAQLPEDAARFLRTELEAAGIQVDANAGKLDLVRLLEANKGKVRTPEKVARILGIADERAEYAAQFVYNSPELAKKLANNNDALHVAGILMGAPRGISVARGVRDAAAVEEAAKAMGVTVLAKNAGEDMMLIRPDLPLAAFKRTARFDRQIGRIRQFIKELHGGTATEPVTNIAADGRILVGDYDAANAARRLNLNVPTIDGVPRPDIAVREGVGLARLHLRANGIAELSVPSTLTRQQMETIRRQIDQLPIEQLNIVPFKAGAPSIAMNRPMGIQVEDQLFRLVGGKKPKIAADVLRKSAQYAKEGVFDGQAAVLPDGRTVEVVRRLATKKGMIQIRDPLTYAKTTIHEDNLALLGQNLEGALAPNRIIWNTLNPKEQELYAQVMQARWAGFDHPITTYSELQHLAKNRGFSVTKLEDGAIRIFGHNTGDSRVYKDVKGAVVGLREMWLPTADLTPPDIAALIGETNIPFAGIGTPLHDFQERVPLSAGGFDVDRLTKLIENLDLPASPGALHQFLTPSRGMFMDLERQSGLPFGRVFLGLQESMVYRNNFISSWARGIGERLPEGVQPLERIMKMAGRGANAKLITRWLEADSDVARSVIAKQMTSRELNAAGELRKWYDSMFQTFGIEADYLQNYAPHLRRYIKTEGSNVAALWAKTKGTPLPKSLEFFADHIRNGTIDTYEEDAFAGAMQYLSAGAYNRFMKTSYEDAEKFLYMIPNEAWKAPLSHYLEAVRGTEFFHMNQAIQASAEKLFTSIGIPAERARNIAERYSLTLLGLSYSATMAFRPGLAIRNMTQTLQTTWTMFGGADDALAEGIARAMSPQGRDAALLDGAINLATGGRYAAEELHDLTPRFLRAMSDYGFRLYDGADKWNRTVAYWTTRVRAERALATFSEATQNASTEVMRGARRQLVRESGAAAFDKPVVEEFLRRAVTNPERAARFLGKNAADVTQWLYGRGNQPRWMRSVAGRLFGQYGTWPLWYLDFIRRTFRNYRLNGNTLEAYRFLGRLGIANGAMLAAGAASGIELGKWAAVHSLFFNGGPGAEALGGIMTLWRGTGEVLFDPENKFGPSRVKEGAAVLSRVGRAYIPGYYAVADVGRLMNPNSPRAFIGALLAVQPTKQAKIQDMIDAMNEVGFMSTDYDVYHQMGGQPTGVQKVRDMLFNQGKKTQMNPQQLQRPIGAPVGQPNVQPGSGTTAQRAQGGRGATTPQRLPQPPGGSFPGESRPVPY